MGKFEGTLNEIEESGVLLFPPVSNVIKLSNDIKFLYLQMEVQCVVDIMTKNLEAYSKSPKADKIDLASRKNMIDHISAQLTFMRELKDELKVRQTRCIDLERMYLMEVQKNKQLENKIEELSKFL